MDHNSIIDKKDFTVYTHAEDCSFAFVCDKRIAPVIALLNKKGYETVASCGGHYHGGCSEQLDVDLCFLEEAKQDPTYFIKEIRDDGFDCYIENRQTLIYILFAKRYDFETVPKGFTITQNENDPNMIAKGTDISCIVEYFDENNKKKKMNIIEEELDDYCNILVNWANDLPDINERKG